MALQELLTATKANCNGCNIFSSSLPDLIRGSVPPTALIGISMIIVVSLIPVIYRQIKRKQADRASG